MPRDNVTPLHRGAIRPIHLSHDWYAEHLQIEDCGPTLYSERLDGKPRRIVIRPALPAWQIMVMCAVAAFIGLLLATGGAL